MGDNYTVNTYLDCYMTDKKTKKKRKIPTIKIGLSKATAVMQFIGIVYIVWTLAFIYNQNIVRAVDKGLIAFLIFLNIKILESSVRSSSMHRHFMGHLKDLVDNLDDQVKVKTRIDGLKKDKRNSFIN